MEGIHVAVCTIEKANSLVNRLAEETRLQVRQWDTLRSADLRVAEWLLQHLAEAQHMASALPLVCPSSAGM